MSHKFEATVQPTGVGSRMLLDGVEVPSVRSFTVKASLDGSHLHIDCLPDEGGSVAGFVSSLLLTAAVFVVMDESSTRPLKAFGSEQDAHAFKESLNDPEAWVCRVDLVVQK